jgi:chromosome partitioning protein
MPVEAIDADPTDTLYRWISNIYEGPPVPVHRETDPKALVPLMTAAAARVPVVVVDTAGFGNQAALVALVASDAVLIPLAPGEADVTQAIATAGQVRALAEAARRAIDFRLVFNRMKPTTLAQHATAQVTELPALTTSLSDLVAFGEMGFSGRLPTKGKAGAEAAALVAELRVLGWLPAEVAA